MGVGSSFWQRVVLFLFVCLFVCFFQLLRWVIILFFKSHKWVRFSCFLFFVFCFFVLFCFVLFCFLFVCFILFFLQNVQFSHHNLGSGWFFFFFFFFWFVSPVDKVFCFLLFCFVFVLFCFVLFLFCFCFPLDIKWCALILILLHRWWWTLRHRQFWITMQFSEKSNSNLKLY